MSLARSVARNTIVQVVGRGTSLVLGLVAFVLIARQLGVEQFGAFTTMNAFLQFFAAGVDLGLYVYLAKRLGEPDVDAPLIVGNVLGIRVVSAVVILGLAPLVALAFPYPPAVRAGIAVLTLSFLVVAIAQVLAGVFQRAFRMGRFITGEVLSRAALVGLVLVGVRVGLGLTGILWIIVVSSALNLVWVLVVARRLLPIRLRFDGAVWKTVLRATWPIALAVSLNVVYFKADTIILSLLRPAADVGLYGAPYRVFEALISLPALFAGLLTPVLAAAFATDRQRFEAILRRGFELLWVAALPLVIGAQFLARDIMTFVDPVYAASGPILRILMLGTAAIFLGYLFSNAVVVVNRQRTMVWAYLAFALGSIALYLPFISRYSYFGAAWVTVGVEAGIALTNALVVLRASRSRLAFGPVGRVLLAGGLMAAVLWLLPAWPWVLRGAAASVVYLVAVIGLRVVDPKTIRSIVMREA